MTKATPIESESELKNGVGGHRHPHAAGRQPREPFTETAFSRRLADRCDEAALQSSGALHAS